MRCSYDSWNTSYHFANMRMGTPFKNGRAEIYKGIWFSENNVGLIWHGKHTYTAVVSLRG